MVEQSYKPKVNPELAAQNLDILEIEQRLEEFWQEEINKLEKKLREERGRYNTLSSRVTNLIASVGVQSKPNPFTGVDELPEDSDEMSQVVLAIRREIDKAADFQKLMDYINGNEILRTQWNRIMVGIRMSGGDEK